MPITIKAQMYTPKPKQANAAKSTLNYHSLLYFTLSQIPLTINVNPQIAFARSDTKTLSSKTPKSFSSSSFLSHSIMLSQIRAWFSLARLSKAIFRVTDRVDEHLSLGDYDSVRKVLRVLPNVVLVREHSGAVVESRGHFVRSLGPGFHFLSLFRREKIWNSLSTQPQMVNTPETVFESKDGNWFSSECVVTFRVIDVAKASYCREIKPWVGLSVGTFPNTMYHLKNAAYSLAYSTSYFHMKTCMSSYVDESNLLLKSTEGQDQIKTILNEFLIDCGLKCELVLMVMLPSMPRKDWCKSLAFANAYETDALLSAFGRDTTLVKALFEAMERYTAGDQKIMLLEELLKIASELLQPDPVITILRLLAKRYHWRLGEEMKNTKR